MALAAEAEDQARLQRDRPVDPFNVDLVYGHNLTGDGGNWLSVSTTVRFR